MKSIAELIDLGVHPSTLGVTEFVCRRAIAWRSADPEIVETPPAAHVERPALERALLALASSNPHIELVPFKAFDIRPKKVPTPIGPHYHVIDATGRRAYFASRVHRFHHPWVARTFSVDGDVHRGLAPLMVAALPDGYLYRATGRRSTTIGIVGRGQILAGNEADVSKRLLNSPARWAVMDLAVRPWRCNGSRPASIQWAEFGEVAAIGDAAFARDSLSSQGLASALLDARYAAEIENTKDYAELAERSRLACLAHATSMLEMLEASWCVGHFWGQYKAEVRTVLAKVSGEAVGQ